MIKRIFLILIITVLTFSVPVSYGETDFIRGEFINTGSGITAYTSMSNENAVTFTLLENQTVEIVSVLSGTDYLAVEVPYGDSTLELYVLKSDVLQTSTENTSPYAKTVNVKKTNCLYDNFSGELIASTFAVNENSELNIIGKVKGNALISDIDDWYVVYLNGTFYYLYIQDTSDAISIAPPVDETPSTEGNVSSSKNNQQLMNVLLSMAIAIPAVIIVCFLFKQGKSPKYYIPEDIDETAYEDNKNNSDDYIER